MGRQNLLTGVGQRLLAERAVIVLDLSQDRVCDGLIAAAEQDGISYQDYQLPSDLADTPLLTGLTGDEIAGLIVEVLHADDASATAAGRATDLMVLRKITRVLGDGVTMARLHEALLVLVGYDHPGQQADGRPAEALTAGALTGEERERLRGLFGEGMRGEVAGNLIRIAAVIEPLAELGAAAVAGGRVSPRRPARLTCLSLPDGPRDVASDLTAALIVQWATRSVAADNGFRPAVILAGADEQSTRHLSRLTTVCERYQVPLVRLFSRLTEESARHLDSRHTAFMRLATRPEALRAAEHIGLARKFVAGRFSHRHSVSRSRTRTSTESTTNTTGRAEGESVTNTTGTTTGQSYSEAEVPRHDNHVHVHAGDSGSGNGGSGTGRSRADEARDRSARERAAETDAESGRGGGRQSASAGRPAAGGPGQAGRRLGDRRRQLARRRQRQEAGDRCGEDQDEVHRPAPERVEDPVRDEHPGDQPHPLGVPVTDGRQQRGRRDHLRARLRPPGPAGDADGAARGPDARPARRRRAHRTRRPCRARQARRSWPAPRRRPTP